MGWQDYVTDGAVAGTTGQDLRVEAIRINLVKSGSTATNKISSIDNNGNTISYTYDKNGNIETINSDQIKYYYNELNELIREDNKVLNKTIVYAYDAGGNIKSKTEYPYTTNISLGTPAKTISYTYGDANWKDKLTSYDGKTISYDEIGNPLTYDGYTWEQGRQLAGINGNGQSNSYKYNDSGIRTEKNFNGVITKYHLVGDKVTYEDNGSDKIYYTYDSANDLVSMNLNGVEYYYIRNAQGDIIGLFDKNGAQVVSYTYDTWGKLIAIDGSLKDSVGVKNSYRYRGYRYDTETGLYYLQSRYYNPEWGRFVNADGIVGTTGELLSSNMFIYCGNNPVNMPDPKGQWAIPAFLGILGEVAVAAVETIVAIVGAPIVVIGLAIVATGALVYEGVQLSKAISEASSKSKSSKSVAKSVSTPSDPNDKNNKKNNSSGKNNLNQQRLNQYKSRVLEGKDVHFSSKEQALDFIQKKFSNFSEEVAGSRSSEGWHFDSHPINGSSNSIDHINIYSKSQGFRVHITWDVK